MLMSVRINEATMLDAESDLTRDVAARDEVFSRLDEYTRAATIGDALALAVEASIALEASKDSDESKAAARRLIARALCGGGHAMTDEWAATEDIKP